MENETTRKLKEEIRNAELVNRAKEEQKKIDEKQQDLKQNKMKIKKVVIENNNVKELIVQTDDSELLNSFDIRLVYMEKYNKFFVEKASIRFDNYGINTAKEIVKIITKVNKMKKGEFLQ